MEEETIRRLERRIQALERKAARTNNAPTVPKYDLTALAGGGGTGTLSFPTRPYAVAYAEFSDHAVPVYPTYPNFDITSPLDWTLESFSNSFYMGDGVTDISDIAGGTDENAFYKIDQATKPTVLCTIKQPGLYLSYVSFSIGSNDIRNFAPFTTKIGIHPDGFSYTPFMPNYPYWQYWDTTKMDAEAIVQPQLFQLHLITGTNVDIKAYIESTITTHEGYPLENLFAMAGVIKL